MRCEIPGRKLCEPLDNLSQRSKGWYIVKEATYIQILTDTLRKKNLILDQLIEHTKIQEIETSKESPDRDRLDESFDQKEALIEQLKLLDSGFNKVYQNVKSELDKNRNHYEQEIKNLQSLIRSIVEKSTILQVMEKQNKPKFQALFANSKKEIKTFKVSSQTANAYYKNSTSQVGVDSHFLDKKK